MKNFSEGFCPDIGFEKINKWTETINSFRTTWFIADFS